MSWSINYIGSPDKIKEALDIHSTKIDGKSKEEFDAVLPSIKAIVDQNYNASYPCVLKVDGNGHAHDGYSNCNISVSQLAGQLV